MFNPNIPQPNDRPSISQGQLLTNFQQLYAVYNTNHIALDSIANIGKHTFVNLVNQGASPATGATDGALYTRTADAQLYWRPRNSGTQVKMTNAITPLANANGFTWFPGGILVQWGRVQLIRSNAIQVFPFNVRFNGNPYGVFLSATKLDVGDIMNSIYAVVDASTDATQFGVVTNSPNEGGTGTFWLAIGPAT